MAPPPSGPLAALARSGIPALTGWPGGPPVLPPAGVVHRLDSVAARIHQQTAASGHPVELDWGRVLTGRAALLGLGRAGSTSANGTCRLVPTADGWAAVNLARPDDNGAVAALLAPAGVAPGSVDPDDPWTALAVGARRLTGGALEMQASLLGIPAGVLRPPPPIVDPVVVGLRWREGSPRGAAGTRVVDLSAMWAGPLATRILTAAGASVTKVELVGRPDGAREVGAFYRWLHDDDQEQILLDPSDPAARERLRTLLANADVVVESSRPRALEQLGAGPAQLPPRTGRVWLSVTAHGRHGAATRVGFGDDAAVAGGLVGWSAPGLPVFVADAVADPITGMLAAAAVLDGLAAGGGMLLDVALARNAAWVAGGPAWGAAPASPTVRPGHGGAWLLDDGAATAVVADPVAAPPVAAPVGAR